MKECSMWRKERNDKEGEKRLRAGKKSLILMT